METNEADPGDCGQFRSCLTTCHILTLAMKLLSIFTFLYCIGLSVTAGEQKVQVSGGVPNPGTYSLQGTDGSLSSLLTLAGEVRDSDRITVKVRQTDAEALVWIFRMSGYYDGVIDYIIPPGSSIYVVECVGLGLGNLTTKELEKIGAKRSRFKERKHLGEVSLLLLQSKPKEANKPVETTPVSAPH